MRRHPTRPDAFGWTGRLRETAEPLFFLPIRACRTYRSLRRTNQAPTDTTSQAREAPIKAAATLISTSIENRAAKASMPTEPSPAPAASSAAASCPRRLPASPAARLRRIWCFSISVALAQKMAGRARKSPPTDAPYRPLMKPVKTVATPPSPKRIRYSYQRPSRSEDGENRIGVMSALRRKSAGRMPRSARRRGTTQWPEPPAVRSEQADGKRRRCRRKARRRQPS